MSGTIDAYGTLITGTVNALNFTAQNFSTDNLSAPEINISDFTIKQSNDKLVFIKDNEELLRLSKNN